MRYVQMIKRNNGLFSKCIRHWREMNVTYFEVIDEKGQRVLNDSQVFPEIIDVCINDFENIQLHVNYRPIIKNELLSRFTPHLPQKNTKRDILSLLEFYKVNFIDHRIRGGTLWLRDNLRIRDLLGIFKNHGYHFEHVKSVSILGNSSGWYLRK